MPLAWCTFVIGEDNAYCSKKFIELFGLSSSVIAFRELTLLFGKSTQSPFQKALDHVFQFGGEFDLIVQVEGGELRDIEIEGRLLDFDNDISLANQHGQQLLLTFSDLTQVNRENQRIKDKHFRQKEELDVLRSCMNIFPLMIWLRDQSGRIKYCNSLYAQALESSPSKVVAESLELVYGENSLKKLAQQAIQTRTPQYTKTHAVVSGERKLLAVGEVNLIFPYAATVGYAHDETNIENLENDLTNHIHAHQDIFDLISTGICVYDHDGHVDFFNTAYLRLFDFKESWLHTKPHISEVLEDLRERRQLPEYGDFPKYKANIVSSFRSLTEPLHEVINHPDGRVLSLTTAPHMMGGLIFMFENITDRLDLERGYNTLRAVQKETIDNLYEGILVVGPDYRIKVYNPSLLFILGLEDNEWEANHIKDILVKLSDNFSSASEYKKLVLGVEKALSDRQQCSEEFFLREKKASYSYLPLPDGAHMFSFIDISDRWRFEQSMHEKNKTLAQLDQLKSDFISHVSYELRSPLHTINGFNDILMNQYFGSLNDRQMDYCRAINESTQKLMGLMNDMIDLASIEAGTLTLKKEPVDLKKLLQSVISLIYNRASDQGLDIQLSHNASVTSIEADERRLKHALFNLLSQSVKFTLNGGCILVKTSTSPDNPGVVSITIEDDGVGFSPEEARHIEQLFEDKNDNQYEGDNLTNNRSISLALSLVKSLISLHNGKVMLKQRKPQGSFFIVELPVRSSH